MQIAFTTAVGHRVRVPRGHAPVLLVAALLGAACRADSVTTPAQDAAAECAGQPGCRATESAPVDPAVFAAVADARERLVPMLDDADVRGTLTTALQSLADALQANRSADARARLAQVYVTLDRLRLVVDGAPVDLPDVAAIRLALVPVANALGVKAL